MTIGNFTSLNGLGLITGQTSGYGYDLSGTSFTGGYYGYANEEYVENAKKSIINGYDVQTTRQAYSTKQSSEEDTLTLRCQTIKNFLQKGRTDDAIKLFNETVETLSAYAQYQTYSKSDIKTLLMKYYTQACNSSLMNDINQYADSPFTLGIKNSNPITALLTESSDAEDFIAVVTDQPKDKRSSAFKAAGTAVGGAAFGALTVTGISLAKNLKANQGLVKSATNALKTTKGKLGLIALAGVAVGALVCGVKTLVGKAQQS